MYRQGRPEDPVFAPDEWLYMRAAREHIDTGRLLPAAISFTEQSVNRSKYSEPEWVLIPRYHHCGIGAFLVRDIPANLASPASVSYAFRPVHVPLEDNYAHSEVRTFRGGVYEPHSGKKVNQTVKAAFRAQLADRAIILKPAASA